MLNKKQDFPIFSHHKNLIYFDSGATTQKPKVFIDELINYYSKCNANIGRGVYQLGENATMLYESVRAKVANFIGASSEKEIVFTSGSTHSINFIATAWGQKHIKIGDEIVVTELAHHANLVPWQRLAESKGATLKIIPIDKQGNLALGDSNKWITTKTKMVALTHISNSVGVQNFHLAKIITAARKFGAKVLVDGAQAVGTQPVNLQQLDCDFYVFSGHKMYGPTGVGVLYIKQSVQKEVEPYQFGGGIVTDVCHTKTMLKDVPDCYEAGTPPIAQVIGLGAAIDYLQSIGMQAVHEHLVLLSAQLIDGLKKIQGITILGDFEVLKKEGHLVSFVVKDVHAHDVAAFLDTKNICVRAGHHCAQLVIKALGYSATVRVSFGVYNDAKEVEYLLECLKELTDGL